jgi:1-phosphatidylinositol-3-phosphate 5-kinase
MAAGGDRRRLPLEGANIGGHQRNVSSGSTIGGGGGGHSRGGSLTQRSMMEGVGNMGDEISRTEARKIK